MRPARLRCKVQALELRANSPSRLPAGVSALPLYVPVSDCPQDNEYLVLCFLTTSAQHLIFSHVRERSETPWTESQP